MNLYRILNHISNHPFNKRRKFDAIVIFFKWQLSSRLTKQPIIYPLTEHSKLIISKGLTGASGNLYCGLLEYSDMAFLLHYLKPEDFFMDVGANIGVYTILASSEKRAKSLAVEPVPKTYKNLIDNLAINHLNNRVKSLNIGLGSKVEVLKFTKSFDTVNHVANFDEVDTIDVDVSTLDLIISKEDSIPNIIKIDVEGFETEVLIGAKNTLRKNDLKAIIIELNGSGDRYGYDENKIHESLVDHGFKPFSYQPEKRELIKLDSYGTHNTIYIRDIDFVKKRLRNSPSTLVGPDLIPV